MNNPSPRAGLVCPVCGADMQQANLLDGFWFDCPVCGSTVHVNMYYFRTHLLPPDREFLAEVSGIKGWKNDH